MEPLFNLNITGFKTRLSTPCTIVEVGTFEALATFPDALPARTYSLVVLNGTLPFNAALVPFLYRLKRTLEDPHLLVLLNAERAYRRAMQLLDFPKQLAFKTVSYYGSSTTPTRLPTRLNTATRKSATLLLKTCFSCFEDQPRVLELFPSSHAFASAAIKLGCHATVVSFKGQNPDIRRRLLKE